MDTRQRPFWSWFPAKNSVGTMGGERREPFSARGARPAILAENEAESFDGWELEMPRRAKRMVKKSGRLARRRSEAKALAGDGRGAVRAKRGWDTAMWRGPDACDGTSTNTLRKENARSGTVPKDARWPEGSHERRAPWDLR